MMETIIKRILVAQYLLDTLHLRDWLMQSGLSRRSSSYVGRVYEVLLFSWLNRILKGFIYLLCLTDGEYRTQKDWGSGYARPSADGREYPLE